MKLMMGNCVPIILSSMTQGGYGWFMQKLHFTVPSLLCAVTGWCFLSFIGKLAIHQLRLFWFELGRVCLAANVSIMLTSQQSWQAQCVFRQKGLKLRRSQSDNKQSWESLWFKGREKTKTKSMEPLFPLLLFGFGHVPEFGIKQFSDFNLH